MNYNIRQQGPNVYEGLFSLIGSIMGNKARERGEIKNYQAQQDFNDQINALDYGGQTSMQDLASRANPNSNYTNKTASLKAQQGLLPTSFNQSVPTSDTLGQGLLGMPKQQVDQQPQRFFADPNIATDMQPDTTPLLGKYAKENNPASVTTSAPKTLQEQQRMVRLQQSTAMKELIAKGYNHKDILPLLQQATNDKITELTTTNQQNMVNELYQGFVNEENPNKKAMYAARLKQAGYDVTTPYKEFAPEYKAEKFDNGNTNDAYSFNPKTGKYELQVSMAKGVSPDAQLRADTSIRTTQMNNDNRITVKGMGGSSGGNGKTKKINGMTNMQINNEISKYKQWKLKNPDAYISEYPRQAQYEDAADPYGNYRNADQQINEIYQKHPDATPEEIFQFLNDRLQRS